MSYVKMILAPTAEIAKTLFAHVTVEAEYGGYVHEGSVYTAAHHQPGMEKLPAPCNDICIPNLLRSPKAQENVVLLSHLDLDSIGGAMRTFLSSSDAVFQKTSFWDLAEFVDKNGPHKLGEFVKGCRSVPGAGDKLLEQLYAFWAWKEKNIPHVGSEELPRDEVSDVTGLVQKASEAIRAILLGDEALIKDGREFRRMTNEKNRKTFMGVSFHTILRRTNMGPGEYGFVNHLYNVLSDSGKPVPAVATYSDNTKSITISLADPVEGVNCCEIVQDLWGPEAGGHPGIAGSPRGQEMTERDFTNVVAELNAKIARVL